MKPVFFFFLLLLLTSTQLIAQKSNPSELEIRFQPDSLIYVFENIGPEMSKSLYTAVIQNMGIVNTSEKPIKIEGITIKAVKNNALLQLKNINTEKIKASAAKFKMLQKHGYLKMYDFQFQTSQYLKGYDLASNDTLNSKEALILAHETFLFEDLPDSLVVSLEGRAYDGTLVLATKSIKTVNHTSKNSYALPLKGSWMIAAGPSLIGHHRWGSVQEFAFDFIRTGKDQSSFKNDATQLEDFYCFGEPVYAIENGVIVSARDGIEESPDNLKKPGESEEDFIKRIVPYQNSLMSKGFEYVFGNHVVIRHSNNEYSNYFHLKNGSVEVKKGDVVKKGQLIGQIGHSGNSTEPHLHFHVSDGPDIIHARSIPVVFDNITLFPVDNGKVRHLHSGQIVTSRE